MTGLMMEVDAVIAGGEVVGDRALVTEDGIERVGFGFEVAGAERSRRGGFLVPGFHDAHLHLGSITAATTGTSLEGATSLTEIADRLTVRGSGDIVAVGFDETALDDPALPDRRFLDAVSTDRAVLVYRVCGHVAIANSVALERAGVTRRSPDPDDGAFDRSRDGEPTGVLRETAIDVVAAAIDDARRDVAAADLVATSRGLAALGLRSVTAMVPAGSPAWCGPDDELTMLIDSSDRLAVDVDAVLISDRPDELRTHAERIPHHGRVRFRGWKGFADGSLGGHTAALSTPYADASDRRGTVRSDDSRLRGMIEAAIELGGSAHIHAIGDAAVTRVLGVFRSAIESGAPADRLFVEHASVLSPALVEAIAGLGVVASVQPSFVVSDRRWIHTRLGPERARWAYPTRSLVDAGARVVGGSDAPVERPDPLAGARAATHRAGFHPEEALDPEGALALFSTSGFEGTGLLVASDLGSFEEIGQPRSRGAMSSS